MSKFNESMVETMKKNGAKSVFINANGEWLFSASKDFAEVSRAEVLGEKADKAETEETPKGKKADKAEK